MTPMSKMRQTANVLDTNFDKTAAETKTIKTYSSDSHDVLPMSNQTQMSFSVIQNQNWYLLPDDLSC